MKKSEEARKAFNAYRRAWAKKNPDKIKAQQTRYWLKQAQASGAMGDADNGNKD